MNSFEKIPAYIYPNTSRKKNNVINPYLDNFMQSTGNTFIYLNKEKPSSTGIFDILKYLFKIDYIFLNWIENVPVKKGGLIQIIFVLMLLFLKDLFKIKVVWTMHNKVSHSSEKLYFKKLIFNKLIIKSDMIITHSKEGIKFAKNMYIGSLKKMFYFPHPINQLAEKNVSQLDKEYDILIWGTLNPYKGIDKFLSYLKKSRIQDHYKVLIVGKPISLEYLQELETYKSKSCEIIAEYLEFDRISYLIKRSKIILFTYSENSVLSSGALMDSIALYGSVIGPNVGAFADLAELGIVKTYDDFSELIKLIDKEITNKENIDLSKKIESFKKDNSWMKFAEELKSAITLIN